MRKLVKTAPIIVLIVLGFSLSACMRPVYTDWDVEIGEQMPEFSLKNLNGEGEVSNASLAGKPYVVSIFATWCSPCRDELSALNEAVWKPLKDSGAQVVAVNYGDENDEIIRQFITRNRLDYPVLADMTGSLRKTLGVQMVPQTVVVGDDGKIIDLHVGVTQETIDSIYQELQAALKE